MKDVLSETTTHLVPTNEEYQLGNDRKLVCSAQVRLSQQAPLRYRLKFDVVRRDINIET